MGQALVFFNSQDNVKSLDRTASPSCAQGDQLGLIGYAAPDDGVRRCEQEKQRDVTPLSSQ